MIDLLEFDTIWQKRNVELIFHIYDQNHKLAVSTDLFLCRRKVIN